jgi:hypothetical protein
MEIKISDKYRLVSQEVGFDVIEKVVRHKNKKGEKGINAEKTGETYESDNVLGYNMSLEGAIKKLIHLTLHTKKLKLTLSEFLEEYKKEKERIEELINV